MKTTYELLQDRADKQSAVNRIDAMIRERGDIPYSWDVGTDDAGRIVLMKSDEDDVITELVCHTDGIQVITSLVGESSRMPTVPVKAFLSAIALGAADKDERDQARREQFRKRQTEREIGHGLPSEVAVLFEKSREMFDGKPLTDAQKTAFQALTDIVAALGAGDTDTMLTIADTMLTIASGTEAL